MYNFSIIVNNLQGEEVFLGVNVELESTNIVFCIYTFVKKENVDMMSCNKIKGVNFFLIGSSTSILPSIQTDIQKRIFLN